MQEYSNDMKQIYSQKDYTPRYSPKKVTQNDKQLSPWNNQQYKKVFYPQQYYQTIVNQHRKQQAKHYNHSKSLSLPGNSTHTNNRISKDFMQLVKLQKKGAYLHIEQKKNSGHQIKMNLVNVNLDDQSSERVYGQTINSFYNIESKEFTSKFRHKQQPVKVRMFKKNIQTKKQGETFLDQNHENKIQNYLPEINNQGNYQKMPKRQLRLTFDRKKMSSTLQTFKNDLFPKLSSQRHENSIENKNLFDAGIFCKGEIIGQKDIQSKRKLKYREYQLLNLKRSNQSNIVFLEQFSSER